METPWDMFGMQNPFNRDPEEFILPSKFTYLLSIKNKEGLEKILQKEKENLTKTPEIINLSIQASIFVNDLNLAYSLSFKLSEKEEIKGLIAYAREAFAESITHFYSSKNLTSNMRIFYSLAHFRFLSENKEKQKLKVHEKILNPIIDYSEMGNLILGTLNFNSRILNQAEKYFKKTKKLNPSEKNHLNLMRTQFQSKKENEVYDKMNEFYINTNSKLSPEEIKKELKKTKIDLPKIKITNLYEIISKLI